MRSAPWLLLALISLASATPSSGQEAYIPVTRGAGFDPILGVTFEPSAHGFNLGSTPRAFSGFFIPAGSDGTRTRLPLGSRRLAPSSFGQFDDPISSPGLLVISGAPQIAGVGGNLAEGWTTTHPMAVVTSIPAVRGDGGAKAGRTVLLSDALLWSRDSSVVSDLGIVNLSRAPMRCSVDFVLTGGGRPEPFEISVPPISLAALQDVIGLHLASASPPESVAAIPQVRCDQQYFAIGFVFSVDSQGIHRLKLSLPTVQLGS